MQKIIFAFLTLLLPIIIEKLGERFTKDFKTLNIIYWTSITTLALYQIVLLLSLLAKAYL